MKPSPNTSEVKKEMTSLDIKFLMPELKVLVSGKFRKIYQYGKGSKQFLFEIFVPTKGNIWLYVNGSKIFLTEYKTPPPKEPPAFCMFLRKHLTNETIKDVRQHEFDRIIEVVTENNTLILELFSKGNVILCNKNHEIIMPLEVQKWKDRNVMPKEVYKHPPKQENPFSLDVGMLLWHLKQSEKKLIAFLAKDFGFGKVYASELCLVSHLAESVQCNEISYTDAEKLHKLIVSLERKNLEPCIYENFVSPFPLIGFSGKEMQIKKTFSEALDTYFSTQFVETIKEGIKKTISASREKLETILLEQEKAKKRLEKLAGESKKSGDLIYKHYSVIDNILSAIKKARESLSWEEIKSRIKTLESQEARAINDIKEKEGIITLELEGKLVNIDIRLSIEANAAKYFEKAKHAKKKLLGIEKTRVLFEKKLGQQEKEFQTKASVSVKMKQKKHWYEKFKWFFSSDGFLVIAGRNAEQNEMLIKKYTSPKDLVFHADIAGAAFVVIKSEGKEVPEQTKKEASEFSAANSKAWTKGLGSVDVYAVEPEQVSKKSKPGEVLGKGSFMVYGKKEWYKNVELNLGIGVKVEGDKASVTPAPISAIGKTSDYFVILTPGREKITELASKVKNQILNQAKSEDKKLIENIFLEEFAKFLPQTGNVLRKW